MAQKKRLTNRRPRRFVHAWECPACRQVPQGRVAREHRTLNRLIAASDERPRRLLAGFLARQHGRGGITLLARITGRDRATVARGRRELRRALRRCGIRLALATLARLLRDLGFSLWTCRKLQAHTQDPDRDRPFRYIIPARQRVTPADKARVRLKASRVLPQWNYTIWPHRPRPLRK
jgi:Rhodopirellula transposase DDE domain